MLRVVAEHYARGDAHTSISNLLTRLKDANAADAEVFLEGLAAGWPKANRSLVIREALLRLADELQGKSSEAIFRYFLERYARRASQSSPSPNGV